MKNLEKESASAPVSRGGGGRGGGGRGRGRGGRRGGRGGARSAASRNGSGSRENQRPTGNQNRGGRGRGRSRSSSYNDKSVGNCTAKKSGPYAHLFCSDRHRFALSRLFYPRDNDSFLLPSHHNEEICNSHRIASDGQLEGWWESVKIVRCHVPFNETTDTISSRFLERCPICLDDEMVR